MSRLTLYHTSGCHLCEEAEELVMTCLAARGMAKECLELAEIADDDELLKRFGLLIPVLCFEDCGEELNWPFGLDDIQRLMLRSDHL